MAIYGYGLNSLVIGSITADITQCTFSYSTAAAPINSALDSHLLTYGSVLPATLNTPWWNGLMLSRSS
jgi:hypothetical protein